MRKLRARHISVVFLALTTWLSARAARAAANEDTQACVDASTAGQTLRDAGHLLAARTQLLICTREVCPGIVRQSCESWLQELERRLPSIVVTVRERGAGDIADARVTLDGGELPLDGRRVMLDPGKHTVVVRAPGFEPESHTFLLVELELARLISIELTPRRPIASDRPAVSRSRLRVPPGAWVLTSVSAAALVSFAVLGSQARNEQSELSRTCLTQCDERLRDRGKHRALAADLSLGVGVAALVGAGLWTLIAGRHSRSTKRATRVSVQPTRGGTLGTWSASF